MWRISAQDDTNNDLKKMKEKTSSSLSGLHCGLWKANAQGEMINEINAVFRDLTLHMGKC